MSSGQEKNAAGIGLLYDSGSVLRDYRLLSKLGAGGMGEVWLGEDTNLERRVAIKILNPELSGDPGLVARFKNEARLQARLVHKNIVTLYNFFTEQGRSYMVMEFAQGITLKDLIRREGMLSEQRTRVILNQLLDALAYAHSMDIIHRDIKPANIMIDTQNSDFVKIMDFGIAKALGEAGLTQTGTRMGTPFYMSPEQILAEKDVDRRTDIFSLGVTLHEMVTGRLPYDADSESPYTIQNNIITQDFADPRTCQADLSPDLCAAIRRMTEKDKARRYGNVRDITITPQSDLDRHEVNLQSGPEPKESDPTRQDVLIQKNGRKIGHYVNLLLSAWLFYTLFMAVFTGLPFAFGYLVLLSMYMLVKTRWRPSRNILWAGSLMFFLIQVIVTLKVLLMLKRG